MKLCVVLVPIIFWTSAACGLTPNQWQYRQSIDVPVTGLVQINLPLETSNIARPDLSDLRIIDSTEKEIPFLIDQPMPRPESSVPVKDFSC
jgi:Replicative DNA helicase